MRCTESLGRKNVSGTKRGGALGPLLRESRGAVLPEFAVVLMPLLICFFTIAQLALATCAKMAVRHAAGVAVRAAAVSHGEFHDRSGERDDGLAQQAAEASLGPWRGIITMSVAITGGSRAQHDELVATITASYPCSVALGSRIVCGAGALPIVESSHLANQGARYVK